MSTYEQPFLYGIGGNLGSGKTAIAHHLATEHDFAVVDFQPPIHEALALINPTVQTASGPTPQNEIIAAVGLETALASYPEMVGNARSYERMLRSYISPRVLVTKTESAIQKHLDEGISVVVDGVKSAEEVAMIRELGGRVVWVERPECAGAAEGALDAFDFDLVLGNGGSLTEMLRRAEWLLLGLSE